MQPKVRAPSSDPRPLGTVCQPGVDKHFTALTKRARVVESTRGAMRMPMQFSLHRMSRTAQPRMALGVLHGTLPEKMEQRLRPDMLPGGEGIRQPALRRAA